MAGLSVVDTGGTAGKPLKALGLRLVPIGVDLISPPVLISGFLG
jgi:hypothetical protein